MDESDADEPMDRRGFLHRAAAGTAGTAAAVGAAGTAAGQETTSGGGGGSGGNASAGGGGGGGTKTVDVGAGSGLSFAPEEVTIAPGTTVVWEWTGQGGAHNVMSDEDGPLDSGAPKAGSDITYEHTFQETGEFPYHCVPHESQGMVGTVIVQQGGASSGGGESEPPIPKQAVNLGVAATTTMLSTLGLAYVFMKYGGDYGDEA